MRVKQRAALQMHSKWWWSYQATYPFGEILADDEEIVFRIPWFKTATIKRVEIRSFVPLKGWPGILSWIMMPGVQVLHANPTAPPIIRLRVPDMKQLGERLTKLGYNCPS